MGGLLFRRTKVVIYIYIYTSDKFSELSPDISIRTLGSAVPAVFWYIFG